jgi:hypothetical protein
MPKRVYFAFDYEDVTDFRANVVRNHNLIGGIEKAGYFDASIWEKAKRTDPATLKRLINSELEYTSTTAVLIGSGTWARRWVRYEIFKSIQRGNRVIGIHINSIPDKNRLTKPLGPNPFDNLGLIIDTNGKSAKPTEWNGQQWSAFQDLDTFDVSERPVNERGHHWTLPYWLKTYDWIGNAGYKNFASWIE